MKIHTPTPQQLAYRHALEEAMRQHGTTLDATELLAITAHLVGQLIALQDQRAVTPAMAIELVQNNIEQGNQEVISRLMAETGGTA
jgi:hypothetical protein